MTKIIVLAAGKGSRMKSDLPKVLSPINGKPMIEYLINSVMRLGVDPEPVLVVSPDNKEIIADNLRKYKLSFALQAEQLGTGHAVASARSLIPEEVKNIMVLYGDHPFITPKSIERLLESHKSEVSMMTAEVSDFSEWRKNFYYWGRILRSNNKIEKIIEFKDASDEIKEVKEVNPAIFCFNKNWLLENIAKIKNENNNKEYYLTDLIKMAFEQGIEINSSTIEAQEAVGINSPEELKVAQDLAENNIFDEV